MAAARRSTILPTPIPLRRDRDVPLTPIFQFDNLLATIYHYIIEC